MIILLFFWFSTNFAACTTKGSVDDDDGKKIIQIPYDEDEDSPGCIYHPVELLHFQDSFPITCTPACHLHPKQFLGGEHSV